jgi:CheY-like chemotaxis protein
VRRYLLVDDNLAFAENMAEIIGDTGAEVAIASSGAQALALVAASRYDAIVTDMRMPSMGGARLVHEVRRVDPGLPALVVTAYTGDDDLAAARREGLLGILPKPVPVERLLCLLSEAHRDGLVAVVEDDAGLSDNLSEALRDRGYSAVLAGSILETERLGPVAPFLALVDLKVPGGPAGEAMRRLAARFPALPMIVITAFESEPPPLEPSGLFVKPFDTRLLLDTIDRLYAGRTAA